MAGDLLPIKHRRDPHCAALGASDPLAAESWASSMLGTFYLTTWAAASGMALAGALAVGPFGAAAAAPYVYGCTPVAYFATSGTSAVGLSIYNGSASSASLTHKILAGNGLILNDNFSTSLAPPPVTSTLDATKTAVFEWVILNGYTGKTDSTTAASIRIVSNVPVSATLIHYIPTVGQLPDTTVCTPQQP